MSAPADTRERLERGLADRYRIERELGQGGMATVHLAQDLKHDRPVALKVLKPELAAVLGRQRFLEEIRLTARLDHPHIVTLIDSGESDGVLWYALPYIRGESLRDRLTREGQLRVEDALAIARQIAGALEFAHRRGVIHRDLKPENILLHEGEAMLADFGIALAVSEAGGGRLTETGLSLGTPQYMSPEQAVGDRAVDARSDVYSLGAVLYEMLAGEPPHTGPNAQSIIAKLMAVTPTPLRLIRDSVPAGVEAAIAKALARAPADRFGGAAEFEGALAAGTTVVKRRRVPLALLTLVLGFGLGLGLLFAWRRSNGPSGDAPARGVRLAVLPFENLGDSADSYFADGVSDAVRSKLTTLPGLAVIARTSSVQYRGRTLDPAQIGKELGVRYLLTGAVRWAKGTAGASRVQVSPELVEITAGAPESRWAQPFDAALTDVFQVQADVAARVADALGVTLGAGERTALAARPTQNVAAYDDFLRGEAIAVNSGALDPGALAQAETWYQRAIERDSSFALAWARLARARMTLYQWDPSALRSRSIRQAVDRAMDLAPSLVEAQLALGLYREVVEQDGPGATVAYRRALNLNPGDADALGLMAGMESHAEALPHFRQARDLDPRSVHAANRLAWSLLYDRQLKAATEEAERGLAFSPAHTSLVQVKVYARLAAGDFDGARRVLRDAIAGSSASVQLPLYWANAWLLTDDQRRQLLALHATTWPGTGWPYRTGSLAFQAFALGDSARGRVYSDSAIAGISAYLEDEPDRAFNAMGRGLHLALVGRIEEARQDRDRAAALLQRDNLSGPFDALHMAWLDVLIGDRTDAVARLERMLSRPHYVTPAWLRIDGRFAPLRGYPPFERLVAER